MTLLAVTCYQPRCTFFLVYIHNKQYLEVQARNAVHSLLGLAYCTGSISTAMLPGSVPGQRPHRLSVICTSCICGIATICCAHDDGVYNFLFLVMRMYRMKAFIGPFGPFCLSLLAITTVDLHALRRVSGKHIFASIDLIAMLMSDCFGNTRLALHACGFL